MLRRGFGYRMGRVVHQMLLGFPWNAWLLASADPSQFLPVAPDFVVEIRSERDALPILQAKMQEYIANGVRLGWLINPQDKQVEVYRAGQAVQILNSPKILAGEDLLPDFVLELNGILD